MSTLDSYESRILEGLVKDIQSSLLTDKIYDDFVRTLYSSKEEYSDWDIDEVPFDTPSTDAIVEVGDYDWDSEDEGYYEDDFPEDELSSEEDGEGGLEFVEDFDEGYDDFPEDELSSEFDDELDDSASYYDDYEDEFPEDEYSSDEEDEFPEEEISSDEDDDYDFPEDEYSSDDGEEEFESEFDDYEDEFPEDEYSSDEEDEFPEEEISSDEDDYEFPEDDDYEDEFPESEDEDDDYEFPEDEYTKPIPYSSSPRPSQPSPKEESVADRLENTLVKGYLKVKSLYFQGDR